MAKELINLGWIEELLPAEHFRKRMFGGFAYYIEDKLVLVIFESEGNKVYNGQTYDFEIWNGCMFPVEKDDQPTVLKDFPFLISHPVLPKWLYLPYETEDFDSLAQSLLKEIRRRNPQFGTIPIRKAKSQKAQRGKIEKIEKFVPRKPQMFSDEPVEVVLQKATKISDLKNLGPESEKTFLKAGIKSPQQVFKLGWKKVMKKLYDSNPNKNGHSIFAYAVIGAVQGKIWNGISEQDKAEARQFMKSLKTTPTLKNKKKTPSNRKKVAKKK